MSLNAQKDEKADQGRTDAPEHSASSFGLGAALIHEEVNGEQSHGGDFDEQDRPGFHRGDGQGRQDEQGQKPIFEDLPAQDVFRAQAGDPVRKIRNKADTPPAEDVLTGEEHCS